MCHIRLQILVSFQNLQKIAKKNGRLPQLPAANIGVSLSHERKDTLGKEPTGRKWKKRKFPQKKVNFPGVKEPQKA